MAEKRACTTADHTVTTLLREAERSVEEWPEWMREAMRSRPQELATETEVDDED
jgi:hypothetical protein